MMHLDISRQLTIIHQHETSSLYEIYGGEIEVPINMSAAT